MIRNLLDTPEYVPEMRSSADIRNWKMQLAPLRKTKSFRFGIILADLRAPAHWLERPRERTPDRIQRVAILVTITEANHRPQNSGCT